MSKPDSDDIFKHIADEYVKQNSDKLEKERSEVPNYTNEAYFRLDKMTYNRIRTLKRKKYIRFGSIAAACLLLVFTVPVILRFTVYSPETATSDTASEAPSSSSDEQSGLITLSFELPDNLSVVETEVDNGVSIYHLDDTRNDDVIMQLESTATANVDFDTLKPITINGQQTYGLSTASYKIIMFINDNVLYTLTCQYDINTLVELSENIL